MKPLVDQFAEIWRLRELLRLMTGREIHSRFTGTALGLVWLYAQPLLTVAAYYFVFDVVFKARLGEGAPSRTLGVYLIVGMVPWMAFADAVSRAMTSLVEAGGLLQKNALAPVLFPARAVVASAVTYLPPTVLVAGAVAMATTPSVSLLWLPVLVAAQLAIAFLLGYALAILAAAMRDVLQVVGFVMSLGVFASPVMFTMTMIPEGFRWLLWLNPMTPVILGFQSVVLSGQTPAVDVWAAIVVWIASLALLLNRLIRRSGEHLVDWL
jgi:lipopolysaccharide transport system permease protein